MPRTAKRVLRRSHAGALALAATLSFGEAWAEERTEAGLVVYPVADFARFSPRTALDIVELTPGFVLEEMAEARGLSAGGGNVLIDGKRPNAKSGGLAEALSRIPASAVARVEVSRGAAASSEARGQSLVVNIVRAQASGHGAWSLKLERPSEPRINVSGDASLTASVAGWDTTSKIQGYWQDRAYTYYHRRNFRADGSLSQFQDEYSPMVYGEAFLSTEAKRPFADGDLALNLRLGGEVSTRDRDRRNYALDNMAGPMVGRQSLGQDIDTLLGEFGAEWVRPDIRGWDLKLVGLTALSHTDTKQWSGDAAGLQRSVFTNDDTSMEAVTRGTLTRRFGALAPEIGAEFAYNRLDSAVTSAIERSGVSGPIARQDALVEEIRGEAFANLEWTLTPRLELEAGLAAELSRLSVSGDQQNEQSFVFLKPSAALSYTFREGVQGRLALRRSVGQLDFTDFAASASFSDGRVLAGNAELSPDQTWRASASLDLRADKRGALYIETFYERIDDVLEQAILNDQGDIGLANQGTADRWGLIARGTLPLHRLVPGARLEANVTWKHSRFDDPITGQTRDLTYFVPLTGAVSFRQDLQAFKVSWGAKAQFREQERQWFVDERNFRYKGAAYSAFIETTRFAGLKARLEVDNIGERRSGETRSFYRPSRAAPLQSIQVSRRPDGQWFRLALSRQF